MDNKKIDKLAIDINKRLDLLEEIFNKHSHFCASSIINPPNPIRINEVTNG
jgi:hypothetical protein